jgi:hypothetical protein
MRDEVGDFYVGGGEGGNNGPAPAPQRNADDGRVGDTFTRRPFSYFCTAQTTGGVVRATNRVAPVRCPSPASPLSPPPWSKTPVDDGRYGPCDKSSDTPGSECQPLHDGSFHSPAWQEHYLKSLTAINRPVRRPF